MLNRKVIRKLLASALIGGSLIFSSTVDAEIKMYEGLGYWIMNDDDSIENDRKSEELTRRAASASTAEEKARIKRELEQADREFLANQKFEEGNRLYYEDKYKEAIKLYDEALELDPNFAKVYENRGLCYRALGDETRARADFDNAASLSR